MPSIPKSQGAALLTALFIMSLVAIVATAMSLRLQLDIHRTRLLIAQDNLYLASQAVTFWGLDSLKQRQHRFAKVFPNGMVALYPKQLRNSLKNTSLSGGLYDLQAYINLNRAALPTLMTLLQQTFPTTPPEEHRATIQALQSFLNPYSPDSSQNDFRDYYHALKPPYNPSHQLMHSKSELRLIKGIEAKHYLALAPFVTALPQATPININTAPLAILKALNGGLTQEQVDIVLKAREKTSMQDNALLLDKLVNKLRLPKDQITLSSQYFLCVSSAQNKDLQITVYSLLQRSMQNNKAFKVSIIRESINAAVF